jgi:Mg-chelatase subunit ChlD
MNVVLAIDTSSSMNEPAGDGRDKLAAAVDAATIFLGFLGRRDRAAIVAFNHRATTVVPLTEDSAALVGGLGRLPGGVGTRLDLALDEADRLLATEDPALYRPVVVLLTDGLQDGGDGASVLAAAQRLKGHRVQIETVGLGERLDAALLQAVASTGLGYHPSPGPADLRAVYATISLGLACR